MRERGGEMEEKDSKRNLFTHLSLPPDLHQWQAYHYSLSLPFYFHYSLFVYFFGMMMIQRDKTHISVCVHMSVNM